MDTIILLVEIAVAVVLGCLIFNFFSHYYDSSGNRKSVREPFFLPNEIISYYTHCQEILEPYISQDFAKQILRSAELQLKDDYKQYKSLLEKQSDFVEYEYYRDLCTSNSYAAKKSWAVLFVRYHLNHRTGQSLVYVESESQAVSNLREDIDKEYEKIKTGKWYCPESFLDYIEIY